MSELAIPKAVPRVTAHNTTCENKPGFSLLVRDWVIVARVNQGANTGAVPQRNGATVNKGANAGAVPQRNVRIMDFIS